MPFLHFQLLLLATTLPPFHFLNFCLRFPRSTLSLSLSFHSPRRVFHSLLSFSLFFLLLFPSAQTVLAFFFLPERRESPPSPRRRSISLSPCQSTATYKFIALINLKYGIEYAQSLWTLMRPRWIRSGRSLFTRDRTTDCSSFHSKFYCMCVWVWFLLIVLWLEMNKWIIRAMMILRSFVEIFHTLIQSTNEFFDWSNFEIFQNDFSYLDAYCSLGQSVSAKESFEF